ncbi:unnamed protein product [Effrenium voratum]|uniref:Peptide deformylase n=1 Tax=Effrenium voratum TaxID=2562239 RepID=A0AA36MP31_9DINO|nr:unnamed protein product [Effrenium voratum]CAJ1374192.1 unnamed protein product [Effrenium voratum]
MPFGSSGSRRLAALLLLLGPCWLGVSPGSRRSSILRRAAPQEVTDASWEPPEKVYSNAIRALPGSATAFRKVLPLGKAVLRRKAKLVKPERISKKKAQNVAEELVWVMRGPNLPGRDFKGGFLTAPHLGTPSRLVVLEDPPKAVEKLSAEERALQGREAPFSCKVIFNPRLRAASNATSAFWERDPSIPGYRALVERPAKVQVRGLDPKGQEVNYVASGWESRLVQQAVDVLDGMMFADRCVMRSLCHLDARNDPLPDDCPALGIGTSRAPLTADQLAAAETGGSKGMLGFLPSFIAPSVLLAGSLLLRLKAAEVTDFSAAEVQAAAKELRDALASGEHPLGLAAPQFGKRLRIVAFGESQESIDKLTTRAQISEEHKVFKPSILVNPVVKPKPGSADAFFFERSASVPGYEAVVGRALEVEVKALDEEGRQVSFEARGWQARQLQHVADLLDGVLYVDRMERRSFRRDNMEEDLPEAVPYGVKAAKAKASAGRRKVR